MPLLFEVLTEEGRRGELAPLTDRQEELKAEFRRARGYWHEFWDGLLELDPELFTAYLDLPAPCRASPRLGEVGGPTLAELVVGPRSPPTTPSAATASWCPMTTIPVSRPNVSVQTTGIARVTETGVRTEDGVRHELEVLVLATGFEASDLPISHRIHGRGGILLADPMVYR